MTTNEPIKRRVLIIFGGRSGEHEVSVVSANHVKEALNPDLYEVELIGITKTGEWVRFPADKPLVALDNPKESFAAALLGDGSKHLTIVGASNRPADVVIPVLHGTYGEDGTVQGFLELTGLPYVGCGVLASAVAMDKIVAKAVFRANNLPVTPSQEVLVTDLNRQTEHVLDSLEHAFQYPMFVKPVNLGSSVGITKAKDRASLQVGLELAASFDRRVMVEPAVPQAREIELAVLGNDETQVSIPGEIVPDREFYDYESKYGDSSTSQAIIPADLTSAQTSQLQDLAKRAFHAIDGAGMARVDFLMNGETGEIFINEINTIPGFTPISMYPKLWEASGISYSELLDRLINLAIERNAAKRSLRTAR